MELKLTFDFLPVAGVLLALLAFYVPGFEKWFSNLSPQWKQGFMSLTLLVITAGAVGLSYFNVIGIYSNDLKVASMAAVVDFFIALIANAGIYKATDKINNSASGRLFGHG